MKQKALWFILPSVLLAVTVQADSNSVIRGWGWRFQEQVFESVLSIADFQAMPAWKLEDEAMPPLAPQQACLRAKTVRDNLFPEYDWQNHPEISLVPVAWNAETKWVYQIVYTMKKGGDSVGFMILMNGKCVHPRIAQAKDESPNTNLNPISGSSIKLPEKG